MSEGLEGQITELLVAANERGGFPMSLLSTEQGLLVASTGSQPRLQTQVAALTALFDDVVCRSSRDLDLLQIDELTIRDGQLGRIVVRPVQTPVSRMFLVVSVPRGCAWRRVTTQLVRNIEARFSTWGRATVGL